MNPTTIDIKISKENVSQTKVEISSLCKNDGGGVLKSPQKWKEKLLEEVNKKLGIYTNTYNSTSNIGNSKDNSQVSQSIGKNIYKFSDVETLTFDKNCKDILNIFLSSSYSIGTIKKLDRKNNHIIINRSFSLLQMTPPTTIDIKFSKIDENKSTVTISTLSKYGELFGSPRVWKNKLLKKVHKIMDII